MAGKRSRRVLEVRGVSLATLKNHPSYRPTTAKSFISESKNSTITSLSSIDDYELDLGSHEEIQQMFVDIDSLLYEDTLPSEFKEDLFHECSAWKEKYAHYRILGRQILPETESGYEALALPVDENSKQDLMPSPTPSDDDPVKLVVQGVHVELNSPSTISLNSTSEEKLQSCSEEEIIVQHGNYEEIIANDRPNTAEVDYSLVECSPKTNFVQTVSENVVTVLSKQIRDDLMSYLRALVSKYVSHVYAEKANSEFRRREQPVLDVTDLSNLRLSTAPSRSSHSNDVDGILTISVKNLQPRLDKSSSLPTTAIHNPIKKLQGAMRLMPIERNNKTVNENLRVNTSPILHQPSYTRPNILPPMQKVDDTGRAQNVKPNSYRPRNFLLQGSHLTRRKLNQKTSKENNSNEN